MGTSLTHNVISYELKVCLQTREIILKGTKYRYERNKQPEKLKFKFEYRYTHRYLEPKSNI